MSVSVWVFLRSGPGDLTLTALDAFRSGKAPLLVGADGFVRCIEVAVHLNRRRAERVLRVAATALALPGVGAPGVLDGGRRCAKRRADLRRWTPTASDHRKAKRKLLGPGS